ncbi:hypothetical protein PMIN02_006280 [Paraphaeosphaeria minitans]
MAALTREELDAWAQENFPEEFALFKAEVDKIMTPTSFPYGYDPNYANGPKPEYRDWILPDPESRKRLDMQSHLILVIGFFNKQDHDSGGPTDKLFVYMTNAEYLNFGRQVKPNGPASTTYIPYLPMAAIAGEDVVMFKFWKRIHHQTPKRRYGTLIMAAALYLHLVRQLLPDFRGPHAVKADFEAAVKAFSPSKERKNQAAISAGAPKRGLDAGAEEQDQVQSIGNRPSPEQAAATPKLPLAQSPFPSAKRSKYADVTEQAPSKLPKDQKDRTKELLAEIQNLRAAHVKTVKEVEAAHVERAREIETAHVETVKELVSAQVKTVRSLEDAHGKEVDGMKTEVSQLKNKVCQLKNEVSQLKNEVPQLKNEVSS